MTVAVSVCIPVFNGERTIERAVESILDSEGYDPANVQIVLCDDRSTDGTRAILEGFKARAGFKVLLPDSNVGLTKNWQRALELGEGTVVTLLHMDDWYAPDCLNAVLRRFGDERDLVLLAMGQEHRLEDGTRVDKNPNWHGGRWTGEEYRNRQMLFEDCPAPSMTFFRRGALRALEVLYDSAFRWCPEHDLYLRLAAKNPRGGFAHDARRLVLRGASKNQFSFRYPGLSILDTCTTLIRHLDELETSEARQQSWAASQRSIALDLLALARLKDAKQLRMLAQSSEFRWWLRSNPLNAVGALRTILARALDAGRRRIQQRT